ncbi:MAG TPA: hypothetical protein VK152_02890, partial [Paludibacter sp.]|nr:hypothetical protein [Paludibacter sp.]
VLVSNGGPAPTYEIQYFADSPSTVNGDLGVAGNENVYGKLTVMDKLGVGTSTPSAKLDVNMPATLNGTDILASFLRTRSSTGGSGIVRIGANSTADLEINSGYSSAGLRYGSYFDFNMVNNNTGGQYGGINFVTNAVARLSIKANGNVGIGTATPGAKLDVRVSEPLGQGAGNYLPLTRINGNGAANNIYINDYMLRESGGSDWLSASYIRGISVDASFLEPSTLRSWIKQKPFDEKIEFGSSGKTLMSIGKDNTTQEARVTVDGTFHAREVTVDLNTSLADYVFSPSYTLMPLHKVEEYVKANSHLPEIPSAAEVKENGLSMGEMQNKLLQKIEELTLYMIEQQKQINDLKAQLQGK